MFKSNLANTLGGKIKLALALFFFFSMFLGSCIMLIFLYIIPAYNGQETEYPFLIYPIILIVALLYMFYITPFLQNKNNYKIYSDSKENIEIFYKGKAVHFNYIITKDSKVDFADTQNKNLCISYKDGSKMRGIVKYRIANYVALDLSRKGIMNVQYATFN